MPNNTTLIDSIQASSALSTLLTLPPLPLDSYVSKSQTDTWTQTGWTKAHIRHLFDAAFTWDYLPFCFLCKDLFIKDYESGLNQFCSSALVHAILALSCRIINENDNQKVFPSGWLGSQTFVDEAQAALKIKGAAESLPNIQAYGVLSLYQMRCGKEEESFKFAEAFASSIIELCENKPRIVKEEPQYIKARSTTYCGAVSLIRYVTEGSTITYLLTADRASIACYK